MRSLIGGTFRLGFGHQNDAVERCTKALYRCQTALEVSDNHPVDYHLTVFGAAYAGGEALASDDAETAAFYTLEEMADLPLAGSVFSVANELLGPGNEAGQSR